MTLPETALFAESAAKAPTNAMLGAEVSDEEMQDRAAQWAVMTPRQKLEAIRDGTI